MKTQLASLRFATTLAIASVALSSFAQWQAVGPHAIPFMGGPPAAGKLNAFAVNLANPLVMYAGGGIGQGGSGPASQAGVYKTTDGGNTWTNANTGLTDPYICALWVNQANPDIVLAGTWLGGIFRSTDAATHWTQVKEGSTTAFRQVGQAVYAGTTNGIAESLDAGATWAVLKATSSPVYALAASGSALYAGLANGNVLFRATPGAAWQTIMTNAPFDVCSIAADPSSSRTLYVACSKPGSEPAKLYVTFNSGGNWTQLFPPGFAGGTAVLAVDDAGTVYSGYDLGLNVSTNHGASWFPMPGESWDNRFLLSWPGTPGKLVVGSDQGLFMTSNFGGSWVGLNGRITSSLLTSVAVSGSTLLTAVQDYSPICSFDGGETWQQTWDGGEVGFVRFNPGNPNHAYAFTTAGFEYSSDGGHSFNLVANLPNTEFTFKFAGPPNQISVDTRSPSNVYVVAKSGIFKSTDWGATWAKPAWPFADPGFVVVSPADSQTIFVGNQSPPPAGVYLTHDGGATWTNSDLGGDSGNMPVALDIDPSNPTKVLMAEFYGRVLLSTNGGLNFFPNNAGLPALSSTSVFGPYVWAIRFSPGSRNGVVALATGNGIYLSAGSDTIWTNISGNVVSKQFTDLCWSGTNLYAATYGEGVLRLPLQIPAASLSVSPAAELTSVGNRGGPFSPSSQQYAVSNNGNGILRWTANASQNWVTITPVAGTNSSTVTVAVNGNATSLVGSPSGVTYDATVAFGGNGGGVSRVIHLTVFDSGNAVLVPAGIQRVANQVPSAVRVRWNPAATRGYELQWATNVGSLVWFPLGWPYLGARSNALTEFTSNYHRKFYRVAELPQPVIPDPQGNLNGDTNRTFMDIVATTLRPEGTNFTLDVQMAGAYPTAAQMAGGKRFDVIWFVDIDRNRATGQSTSGNDYNIHIFLDETGWHYWWFKVSPLSQADRVVNVDSAFKITVAGDRATLTFPRAYLPSLSFEMWATCFSGNASNWPPVTENPTTARAVFNF